MTRTIDDVLAEVRKRMEWRTMYEGREPPNDEMMLAEIERLRAQPPSNVVPGNVRCAKCKFILTRTNLYMRDGITGPGDNKTEPCPNGCGPLWPMTWQQLAEHQDKVILQWADRAHTAEAEIDRLRATSAQATQGTVWLPLAEAPDKRPENGAMVGMWRAYKRFRPFWVERDWTGSENKQFFLDLGYTHFCPRPQRPPLPVKGG